jgi:hypothetical protein
MPRTEFRKKLFYVGDELTVNGTLETPNKDDARANVFAFVTQHQPAAGKVPAKTVTVAGEARLKVEKKTATTYNWVLDSAAPISPPSQTGWAFNTKMEVGQGKLCKGPAFGTAVLVTLQEDGTIETYAWSGWVEIKPKPKPRSKPKP